MGCGALPSNTILKVPSKLGVLLLVIVGLLLIRNPLETLRLFLKSAAWFECLVLTLVFQVCKS